MCTQLATRATYALWRSALHKVGHLFAKAANYGGLACRSRENMLTMFLFSRFSSSCSLVRRLQRRSAYTKIYVLKRFTNVLKRFTIVRWSAYNAQRTAYSVQRTAYSTQRTASSRSSSVARARLYIKPPFSHQARTRRRWADRPSTQARGLS